MVRSPVQTQKDRYFVQWLAAWRLLPSATRWAIASFCTGADPDIAEVVLGVREF